MPIEVEVPNFGIVEFPDGMNQEDISSALASRFSQPPHPAADALNFDTLPDEFIYTDYQRPQTWDMPGLESSEMPAFRALDLSPPRPIDLSPAGVSARFVDPGDTVVDPLKDAGIGLG